MLKNLLLINYTYQILTVELLKILKLVVIQMVKELSVGMQTSILQEYILLYLNKATILKASN